MKKLSYLIFIFLSLSARAQKAPDSLWNEVIFKNSLPSFDNVLLGAYLDSGSTGNSSIGYFQRNNKFRDAYMPSKSKGFTVNSAQYVALKDWRFYGSFTFSKFEDIGTQRTELADPYRNNPYKIMDSLTADWNKQYYLLRADIVSQYVTKRMRLGMGIKYEVLNGARQKDPRPLDKTINITLTPSLLYALSPRFNIGLNGFYHHFVEDLSITMENSQRSQNIYKTLGLGEYLYNGPILLSGSLSRAYLGNTYGGGFSGQYSIQQNKGINFEFSYKRHKENVTDGTSTPYNAGTHVYKKLETNISYHVNNAKADHLFGLYGSYLKTSDTEYVQTLNSFTKMYEVIYSSEMHHQTINTVSIQYKGLYRDRQGKTSWNFAGGANYLRNTEDYPSTLSNELISYVDLHIGVKKWFYLSIGNLSVIYNIRYKKNLEKSLTYYPNASSSNFVAYNIMYPNYYFNTANRLSNLLGVQYDFKKLAKGNSRIYVKATFENIRPMSNTDVLGNGISNNCFELTLGLLN